MTDFVASCRVGAVEQDRRGAVEALAFIGTPSFPKNETE
jgi:hypothetical protein